MPYRTSVRCTYSLPLFGALCLGAAVCAAAPKKAPAATATSASPKSTPKPNAPAASAAAARGNTPNPKAVSLAIPSGKPGTWSGKQANVATPIAAIVSAGSDIYAVGSKTVFHSANGGQEWLAQPVDFSGATIWSFGQNDVWIAGSKLAHSTDQGKSWTVTTPFSKVSIYSLWAPDSREFYAVGGGGGGAILHSQDGGKTFTKQSPGIKGGWLYDVVGNGDEVFVAGKEDQGEGSRGVLLVTKDHGKNWKRVTLPAPTDEFQSITHICFSDPSKMYITTSYEVLVTANRGKTWKNLFSTNGAEILGFACKGKELYVAGRGRHFHHSSDGGATWNDNELTPVFTGKAISSVQAVHITERGDVFAGGEGEYTDMSGSLFRLNR
jgi:photosystem II stability/assembly factor-like uncharacterized protein